MITFNPNSLCRQSEVYYYDFLCNESRGLIPEFIINHMEQCQHCQEQIKQLRVLLSQAEDEVESEQEQINSAITTMLKLHFAYIGKHVTCKAIKSFIPTLLDPALEIRIPTPITTHLDSCRQCSKDLETIRRLNLERVQLCRLSQVFADKHAKNNVSCRQAHAAILAVVSMDFRETKEKELKHLCTCPYCRKLLYQYRQAICKEHLHEKIDQKFPCQEVSATDIFDYVIPYGLDPASDQYAKFRESLTSHLRTCPTCLAKMQQLHDTVYEIAERAESEVVTIYHIGESAKAQATGEADELYSGLPIRVEVTNPEDEVKAQQSASTIDYAAALEKKVSSRNIGVLAKIGFAAAAVILIAVGLFLSAPTAKAVSIDQIYEALERIKNVCITTFYQEESNKTQEIWISRTLNIKILKLRTECFLWDIKAKTRTSKNLNTGSITVEELDSAVLLKVKETMEGPLGLLPYNSMPEAPEGAKWLPVANENIDTIIPDTEVYDLMWTDPEPDGSIVYNKWRGYIDVETKLPRKVEWWEKKRVEEEYLLLTIIKVAYPTAAEIQVAVGDVGF